MPIEITMPRLSDTMEEGTLIKWRVKVGDAVKNGDVLADVETDKATMELQSYDDGTVAKLAVDEGQTTAVGKLILLLAEEGESVEDAVKASGGGASEAPAGAEASSMGTPAISATKGDAPSTGEIVIPDGRVRVSPVARQLAQEHGVDVAKVRGSGPDGRVIKRDILAAAQGSGAATGTVVTQAPPTRTTVAPTQTPAPTPGRALQSKIIPLTNMRKTIARRLVESKTTIPHFTVTVAVNMDPLMDLRASLNAHLENQGVRLSVNDFIVRAAAVSLVDHPVVNSSWTDGGIVQHGVVNVGVAIALPEEKGGGLVVATIRDAHTKPLRQISGETRTLAKKARDQGLNIEEMSDGTLTVSNLGMYAVEHFEAIINPPQAAILALGGTIQKPVARDGQVVVGREMTATLSADHRVIDGATAAQFLQTLKQILENPAVLLV